MSKDSIIYNSNFTVNEIDPQNVHFDYVSRYVCSSEGNESKLTIDINKQIYPLKVGDRFTMAIVQELTPEGHDPKQHWNPLTTQNSLAKTYDYVMHGHLYRYVEDSSQHEATVYVSFGGLIMVLQGEQTALNEIRIHNTLYLLIRKIQM